MSLNHLNIISKKKSRRYRAFTIFPVQMGVKAFGECQRKRKKRFRKKCSFCAEGEECVYVRVKLSAPQSDKLMSAISISITQLCIKFDIFTQVFIVPSKVKWNESNRKEQQRMAAV